MPCTIEPRDDDEWVPYDADEDDDFPEGEDAADDGCEACPDCGDRIYDDSVRCPSCGHYLSGAVSERSPRPLWIIVGALAALAGMVFLL